MKSLTFLLVCAVCFSCDMNYYPFPNYNINLPDLEKRIQHCDEEKGIQRIKKWIKNNIDYKKDIDQYGVLEYWASPLETIRKGAGDCEDKSILFSWLCYQYYNVEPVSFCIANRDTNELHMVSYVYEYKYYYGVKKEKNNSYFKNGDLCIFSSYDFVTLIMQAEYFR